MSLIDQLLLVKKKGCSWASPLRILFTHLRRSERLLPSCQLKINEIFRRLSVKIITNLNSVK